MSNRGFIGGSLSMIILLVVAISLFICTERIPAGYEGVVYEMNGGISGEVLSQGWHIVSPTKKIKIFTVGNEQLVLSKDSREGSKSDDSFKVSTSDDAMLSISFQMSYRFISERLPETFTKFKGLDGEDIVEKRVKTVMKSKISEVTTAYSMMDIYSGNRSEINNKITAYLNEELGEKYGIEVTDASIIDVHPDKRLKTAIDNRVEALQKKQQAEAEQETAKVEAETKMIKAQKDAEIKKVEAQAAADVKVLEAQAEAEANKLKSSSITDELIRMKEAEARYKHGWVEIQGVNTVATEK